MASANQKRDMKSNDSTAYNMATDVNPLNYVKKQGKYVGIYLIWNVSGQTDHLLARATGPRVKLSASGRREFQTLRRDPRTNLTTPKDSQPMISYRLVSHCKPLGPTIREI